MRKLVTSETHKERKKLLDVDEKKAKDTVNAEKTDKVAVRCISSRLNTT